MFLFHFLSEFKSRAFGFANEIVSDILFKDKENYRNLIIGTPPIALNLAHDMMFLNNKAKLLAIVSLTNLKPAEISSEPKGFVQNIDFEYDDSKIKIISHGSDI